MNESPWNVLAHELFTNRAPNWFDSSAIAMKLGINKRDVVATLDALDYLEEYLTSRGKRSDWRNWLCYEFAFRQIVVCRSRLSSAGDKVLFATLAFILIDNPTPRPLSREIERLRVIMLSGKK